MRFGRIILAALAPLFSLTAVAGNVAQPRVSHPASSNADLLRSMVLFVVSAAEGNSLAPAPATPPAQAVLALGTLLAGHFKHSLWLMTSLTVIDLYSRQHRRALLRC